MSLKTNKISILTFFLITLPFTFSCTDSPVSSETPELPDNEYKVTIDQGVWGNVQFWEGDFMPIYNPATGGTITPVVRDICVHVATSDDMVEREGYGGFYKSINSELISIVRSDKDGFFQIELEPGKYSFFVKEDALFYGSRMDGNGNIEVAEVIQDSTTKISLDINYMATY